MKIIFITLVYLIIPLHASKYGNKTFNEWTWLTAHNSNLNIEDSSVVEEASNQKHSISKLLEYGVRGFMLDISIKKCSAFEKFLNLCPCEGICLCHGECKGSLIDGFNNKPYMWALRKILNFLNKNTNEIITIFLENHVQNTQLLRQTYSDIAGLKGILFDPFDNKWNVTRNGWPKLVDMIKENKRLLIVDDEKKGIKSNLIPGTISGRDFFIENHFQYFLDSYNWTVRIYNDTYNNITQNETVQYKKVFMPRCFSVHKINRKPIWDIDNPLKLNEREHDEQVMNKDKLFLFNHFFGVYIASAMLDSYTLKIINTKDFIVERIRQKCDNGTNFKKPNFIALDFIDVYDAQNILPVFNN